jgi:hypothetical protein
MVTTMAFSHGAKNMKLIRFDGGKTGLLVEISGAIRVIDVIASLGVLSPGDPISLGILNGILKDKGSWAALIQHWPQARIGLRRLAAAASSTEPSAVVLLGIDEIRLPSRADGPDGIASLEIVESMPAQYPTGREAIVRQFADRESAAGNRGTVVVLEAHQSSS